jgi:superfamily II DNA or RNA helicase
MSIDQLYTKLKYLKSQKLSIEKEILQIQKQINKLSSFSKEDKIKLFRSLFIGRQDVYAKYWVSKDGTKRGYSPATYTFKGNDYIPIDDIVIQNHLEGKIRIGTYVVISQTMTKFLVIDLDKKSFIEDARALKKVCNDLHINSYMELSKSGNGIHIWFFFETLVKASYARKLGDILITKAMDLSDGIGMDSYDRMFPNQDFVAPDALGNLIALPLHFGSRKENKTVFIDIDTMQPYDNQWDVLRNVKKLSSFELMHILKEYAPSKNIFQDSLMPWEIKQQKPLIFPKIVKAVLYNALYIEKLNLSKQLLNKIQKLSSFLNPQFFKLQNLRKSTFNTPRIISLYDINEKYIIVPRALKDTIKQLFDSNKSNLVIEDKRVKKTIKKPNLTIKLNNNQKDAFKKIIENDYSLLIAPPGFGKTVVAAAVLAKRRVNTLILVHKVTLLYQWTKRLSEYFNMDTKDIGQLGDGKKKLTSHIDIAILHSLKNKPEIIREYSQIIIDEVHHIPAISFEMPIKNFQGKYIVGLSATPKRKDGLHPIMFMQCGNVVYEAESNKKNAHILQIVESNFETFEEDFALILNEMIEDIDRNKLIISEVEKLKNRNILILSERVEHLNILYHMLVAKNITSILLHGGLKTKMQKEAMIKAQNANIILSTSSYIGEGIDFSHLDTIVFTMPISYDSRIIQYLGRIGRRGQKCLAVDFVDNNVAMLKSSFKKRMSGYKKMGYIHFANDNLFNM